MVLLQCNIRRNLNLSRIQPGFKGDTLKGVLIIFFAHRDKEMGQVVVGWYKNATVTSYWNEKKLNGIKRWYWAKSKQGDGSKNILWKLKVQFCLLIELF